MVESEINNNTYTNQSEGIMKSFNQKFRLPDFFAFFLRFCSTMGSFTQAQDMFNQVSSKETKYYASQYESV